LLHVYGEYSVYVCVCVCVVVMSVTNNNNTHTKRFENRLLLGGEVTRPPQISDVIIGEANQLIIEIALPRLVVGK
jgi:hypothetical protein